ncbi:MAG: AzlC family ABC transporter permease [Actinomycetaceae bacterium]|nr:AzlC family ABC transporter permease [Actinomycetaceae bacterium]
MAFSIHDSQIRAGLRDSFAVTLGYIPLGAGMGMILTGAGFDWWWAPIFSVFIYAGSMQYLMVPMIAAAEPLLAIALATFLIQFRHIFYGISFPLDLVKNRLAKAYSVHALTDEVYAVISSRERTELSERRIILTQILCHTAWISGCTLGALLGLAFPVDIRILNFVLTALLIVLLIENYKANPRRLEILIAGGIAVGALFLPSDLMLPIALTGFTAMLVFAAQFARAADG